MFKWWKFGLVAVGSGVMVGGFVVGWLYLHRDEGNDAVASKAGPSYGSPAIGVGGGGQSDSLAVTNNGSQGLGGQGQALGQSTSGQAGSSGGGGSSAGSSDGSGSSGGQLPTPSQFKVYDQYKNNPTALYIDVKPGTGTAVVKGSKVTINYRGWLTDGSEFDESYARGKPYTFTEGDGSVIAGMAEAVFGMKAGGTRRLIIPPAVGYGAAGQKPVPPDAMMIFDVELVSVQ